MNETFWRDKQGKLWILEFKTTPRGGPMPTYQVIVSNLGTVHHGHDRDQALECYAEHVGMMSTKQIEGGRVVLMEDELQMMEYSYVNHG
jgi:hypothetical protein